jgi:hypothetical protein
MSLKMKSKTARTHENRFAAEAPGAPKEPFERSRKEGFVRMAQGSRLVETTKETGSPKNPGCDDPVALARRMGATGLSHQGQRQEKGGSSKRSLVLHKRSIGSQTRSVVLPHQALIPGPMRLFVS